MREFREELRTELAAVLLGISEARRVPKGCTWIREHEHAKNKGFVLLKGTAKILKSDTPEILCRAPELIGEMMQFSPLHERTATVLAAENCVVLQFIWDDFWARVEAQFPQAARQQIRSAVEGLAWTHLTG